MARKRFAFPSHEGLRHATEGPEPRGVFVSEVLTEFAEPVVDEDGGLAPMRKPRARLGRMGCGKDGLNSSR